jgi:hypothetical protein
MDMDVLFIEKPGIRSGKALKILNYLMTEWLLM